MKRKIWILVAVVLAALIVFKFFGGGKSSEESAEVNLEKTLVQFAKAESVNCTETDGNKILHAKVTMPDYAKYMQEVTEDAEKNATSVENFGEQLYSLAIDRITSSGNGVRQVTVQIDVDLSAINPEKKKWTDAELRKIACEEAFLDSMEEYCYSVASQISPEFAIAEQEENDE